jgi:hypothetical protein
MLPPIASHLFRYSQEQTNWSKMVGEWVPLHREVSDELCECPCGKEGIRELCHLTNLRTGYIGFVGNCCILHLGESVVGYCSAPSCPYPCVSHTAHFCEYHAHNRKDAPTGFITRGKWRGKRYNDPCLAKYAEWAIEDRNRGIDPHYLAWLDLQASRKQNPS